MELFVETRSSLRLLDYRFLGSAPADAWWRRFTRLTILEEPSLILLGGDAGWRLIASAIPSVRHDSEGARIRFTLAAEGDNGVQDDARSALRVIRCWLADSAAAKGTHLGQRLDDLFTGEFTNAAYESEPPPGDDYSSEVRSRLGRVVDSLPDLEEPSLPEEGSWYAGLQSPVARSAFAARCEEVLAGTSVLACVLNSAGEDRLHTLSREWEVAVLLPEGPAEPVPVLAGQDLEVAHEPEPPGKVRGRDPSLFKRVLASLRSRLSWSIAGGLVILSALLLWVLVL